MEDAVRVENLYKFYSSKKKKLEVLRNISFCIKTGEFVAIMGASGAGKTTLLNILGTLDTEYLGDVYIFSCQLDKHNTERNRKLRLKNIGFVYQGFHLIPFLNVLDNVMLPQMLYYESGKNLKTYSEKAGHILSKVGLAKHINKYPAQLSFGEQQRVAIARSLINDPRLILADEPTGNLDYHTGKEIMTLFKNLCRERNTTTLLVTHNLELAHYADRILFLENGTIKEKTD